MLLITGKSYADQKSADSLFRVITTATDDSMKFRAILEFSKYIMDTQPDSAFFMLEEADKLLESFPSVEYQVKVNNNKSIILQNIGKYPEAIELLFSTKQLMETLNGEVRDSADPVDYLNTVNNIGLIFYKTDRYDKAIEYFTRAIEILNSPSMEMDQERLRNELLKFNLNIGAVHTKLRDFEKAEFYFTKALQYLDENESVSYPVLLNNLAIVARENGNLQRAFELNRQAIEITEKTEDYRILTQNYNNMGNNFTHAKMYDSALRYYEKARVISEKYDFLSSLVISLDMQARINDSLGNYEDAYKYHVQFKQYSDSLFDLEKIRMVTQLEMKDKFDKRMAAEQFQQKEREAEQKKRELIFTLIIIFSLMGLIIVVLLFYLQRSKSKRLRLEHEKSRLEHESLTLQKTKLEEELEFKNKQLATNVMYMVRKNELITLISEKLIKSKLSFKKENQVIIDEIIRDLQSSTEDDIWTEFEIRFQQVHNDFYDKLNARFPNLSANEKKLCAFLRLNMTTKEISAITYQSINSLTVARSRLRKKLNLDTDENLIAFLENI